MHEKYMQVALEEAKKAYDKGEVPVGAVIVYNDTIIAAAHNRREETNSSLSHAEIEAISIANKKLNTWMLNDCTLYVTLEPCIMCAGACIQSRVGRVVFGSYDPKGGSFGSTIDLTKVKGYNHYPNIIGGVLEEASANLLKDFFLDVRKNRVVIKQVRTDEELKQVLNLRSAVFVEEQGVDPLEEYDAYDVLDNPDVVHIIASVEDEAVGTVRLIKKDDSLKVGRVAVRVDKRHLKIGTRLMDYAEKYAFNNGFKRLELGAQLTALPFYERCGYEAEGEVFMDAQIEHRMMYKKIR